MGLCRTGWSSINSVNSLDLNERSLSAVLICRFHLDLQRRIDHPSTGTLSQSELSLGSFRATRQKLHNAVVAEFGDTNANTHVELELSLGETVFPEIPASRSLGDDIGLAEIQPRSQSAETGGVRESIPDKSKSPLRLFPPGRLTE